MTGTDWQRVHLSRRVFLAGSVAAGAAAALAACGKPVAPGAGLQSQPTSVPASLDAAINAYAQVLNSPAAGPRLRGRAQVGMGLVLEKKAALSPPEGRTALLKQALENYLNLLYTDEVADAFWQKKAGLQALPLLATVGDRNPEALDKFFDRLEKWLPQLKKVLEKKKAALGALKN